MKRKNVILGCLLALSLASCGGTSTTSENTVNGSSIAHGSSTSLNDKPSSTSVNRLTPKEEFLKAKNAIQNLDGYSYSDSLQVNLQTALPDDLEPSGVKNGTICYSSTSEINKVSHYELSGALFFDGNRYEIEKDNARRTIDLDENGSLKKITEDEIDGNETSSFAKAIFEYDDSKIKDVKKAGSKYEIETTMSASTIIEDMVNILDSSFVRSLVGTNYPGLTPDYSLTATIVDDLIKTFDYSLSLTVLGQTIELSYHLQFTDYNDTEPSLPSNIPGLSLSDSELQSELTKVNGYFQAYKSLDRSGYDYKSVVDVDFVDGTPILTDVSTTVQGETKRVITDGSVYYENRVEMDTNLPDYDSEDYERYRVKTLDNKVYDVKNKLIGHESTEVTDPLASDEYYFFLSSLTIDDVFYIVKDDEKSRYEIVLSQNGVSKLINLITDSTRLDVTLAKHDSPFGTYSNLTYDTAIVEIGLEADALSEINVSLDGEFYTVVPNYKTSGEASWKATLDIKVDNSLAEKYEVPATEEDIDI